MPTLAPIDVFLYSLACFGGPVVVLSVLLIIGLILLAVFDKKVIEPEFKRINQNEQ